MHRTPPDHSRFPDPVYQRTVLAPLFETTRQHYVEAVDAINQAHLVMLCETGIIDSRAAADIARALVDIAQSLDTSNLQYSGEHEDYFFLLEHELRQRLGTETAGRLHTARSRNDMDHTIFRIVLKKHADALLLQALDLASALLQKAGAERDTLIVAYTHGQPAQPDTLGHYLAAVLEVLLRDINRLEQARDNLDSCPMGAAAITTSGFAIDRERVAGLLGFTRVLLNSYGCIASVDYISAWYSALKLLFLHLGRVIQDLQFWSAFEVGQLYIPNSLVQISSIMPQKRNPVPIEHLRHLASISCGRCDAIINTLHNTPFTDMNDSESEVQQAGYAAFDSGGRVLALFARVVEACSIDQSRVEANTRAACITITELADTLVRRESLSFREAHEIAAAVAQSVIADGQALDCAYHSFVTAFASSTGRSTRLDEAGFREAVSARYFIAIRNRSGGPGAEAMAQALALYDSQLESARQAWSTRQQQASTTAGQLAQTFRQLQEN